MAIGNRGQVESVVGLTQLEHHVVGNINNRVERPHTRQHQPVCEPLWRCLYGDPTQHSRNEPAAQRWIKNLDCQEVINTVSISRATLGVTAGVDAVIRVGEVDTECGG